MGVATLVKFGIIIGTVGFGASYMDVFTDLIMTVKTSLVSIELSGIDDALQREKAMTIDNKVDPYPETQENFNEFMRKSFEDRGRDAALDQFQEFYIWRHRPGNPAIDYVVACKGQDKTINTDDDIIMTRDGPKRRISQSLEDVAATMSTEMGKAAERNEQQRANLESAISQLEGEGGTGTADATAAAEEAASGASSVSEAATGLLGRLKNLSQEVTNRLNEATQEVSEERKQSLQGLGAGSQPTPDTLDNPDELLDTAAEPDTSVDDD